MPPSLGEETEEGGHPPFSSCRVDLFFVRSRSAIVVTPIYFRREARKEVTVASSSLFVRRGGLCYFYTLKMVVNEPPHLLPTEEEQRVTIHPPFFEKWKRSVVIVTPGGVQGGEGAGVAMAVALLLGRRGL